MPISTFNSTAGNTSTNKTVYVWESRGQPGEYALCTNRAYPDYATRNWKFRGDLARVAELDGMPRGAIDDRTVHGWPMVLTVDRLGSYIY